ncbi:hypothetical protein TRVL_04979 [Trypanosoma vivax]|nr:hypothetical protein TRVL_04979 [Trypanosoma vivax]
MLPWTFGRATLGALRFMMLVSGGVERNHGPLMRGAQWNAKGLSKAKKVALERKLHLDTVLFCILQRVRPKSTVCAALKIGGCQHVAKARAPHGGVVSILVIDGVGVEVGILD